MRERALIGCLLGTAVGDALGLPCEGLPKRRQRLLFPDLSRFHFLLGRGMVSDDTEHTCLVAQALLAAGGDEARFARSLAWQSRWWLFGVPAGIGKATLLAILKLWVGVPPDRSGVFSAGNGPAMRSALLGIFFADDLVRMRQFVRRSARITHTDPKAEYGAFAVALAAALASRQENVCPQAYEEALGQSLGTEASEFLDLMRRVVNSAQTGQSTEDFAADLGLGERVSGYVYHTVPVAVQAWLRHQGDYRAAVTSVIRCGGDTDTTAAITVAITGAQVGKDGIPVEWLDRLWEWPRSVAWMEELGKRLAAGTAGKAPLFVPAIPIRNLLFLLVVLLHGFRRLLPPY